MSHSMSLTNTDSLFWSKEYKSKTTAGKEMKKKENKGFTVSGIYCTPDNKHFFVGEKK